MPIAPIAPEVTSIQANGIQRTARAGNSGQPEASERAWGMGDKVEISAEGRAKAKEMKAEGTGEGKDEAGAKPLNVTSRVKGKDSKAEKEEAVDDLKDTTSDIKKKEDELQEAKNSFQGSAEDQEAKVKKLQKDIRDLNDSKKKLESKLSA